MGYNGYDKPLTEPLSNFDVAKALGENTLDIGSLCTSESINKWSFHKPMSGDNPNELTLQEKYDQDGGYSIPYTDVSLRTADNIYRDSSNSPVSLDWALKALTWYRLTDFIGYNPVAKNFSPIVEVEYPSSLDSGIIHASWNSDLQQHISKFNSLSASGIGLLLTDGISDKFYGYYCLGSSSQTGEMSASVELDEHLGQNASFKVHFVVMPVASSETTKGLYTEDDNISVTPLPGLPVICTYKTLLYRIFENVTLKFSWYQGGYNPTTGQATFTGEAIIQNDNDFDIYISLKLFGNAYYEEQGNSNSWVTIFETTGGTQGMVNNINRNFVLLEKNQLYAMTQHGGQAENKWFPHVDNKFAMVRVETAVRVLLNGRWLTKSYDTQFSFDHLITEQYNAEYNYVDQELIETT